MSSIVVLCIFGLSLSLSRVGALRCHTCFDVNTGPCFNPPSNTETCTSQMRNLPADLQRLFSYDEVQKRSDSSSNDIRCYHYQTRHYLTNTTEVHRGCLYASFTDTLCSGLQNNAQILYYNLTTCRTCNTDLCNSSGRLDIKLANIVSIFAMVFISFNLY